MGVPQSFLGRGSYREDQLVGECAAEVKRILVSVRCASCYTVAGGRVETRASSRRTVLNVTSVAPAAAEDQRHTLSRHRGRARR